MGCIAGVQYYDPNFPAGENVVRKMLGTICGSGTAATTCYKNTAFGIQCDSLSSSSPGSDGIWVILDGQIFSAWNGDYVPGPRGSHLDQKIILSLYQKYNEDFVEKIDGSYSIAIYNGISNRLLLVRDRLGCKPLFYLRSKDALLFASEIKPILNSGLYKKSVDLEAMNNFLSCGYVPGPRTLFKEIRQVKPGHVLISREGNVREKSYWKFTYQSYAQDKSETGYEKRFLEIFETAVSRRLRRYPDAGAFLSGGLDTSGVVAVMHKLKQFPFKVFTAGFKEEQHNEIGDAEMLARHLGLDHHTVTIKCDKDFPFLMEKLVWHHGSPFADTSAIPSYFVAELAKKYVDVVLTGDFPDQLLGGSGHHAMALYRESNDRLWRRILRNRRLNQLVTGLAWHAGSTTLPDKIKRFLYRETFPLEEQRVLLDMPIPPLLKRCLYSPDLLEIDQLHNPLTIARSIYRQVKDRSLLDKLLYFDIVSYAPDDLMVKVDRMAAAHGLIAISPFHDRDLVEFIATVPASLKIKEGIRKYVMREALKPMLPEQTLNKKKQGFAMPIREWLVGNLSDYVGDILLDSRTLGRGYFDKIFMRKMVENFLAGKTDYASGSAAAIVSLITLELWHRIFLDN